MAEGYPYEWLPTLFSAAQATQRQRHWQPARQLGQGEPGAPAQEAVRAPHTGRHPD